MPPSKSAARCFPYVAPTEPEVVAAPQSLTEAMFTSISEPAKELNQLSRGFKSLPPTCCPNGARSGCTIAVAHWSDIYIAFRVKIDAFWYHGSVTVNAFIGQVSAHYINDVGPLLRTVC